MLKGTELYISKRTGKAIMDYKMLSNGDRVAVAVSGGKDSLALLNILSARRRFVPIEYGITAVHIDTGYPRSYSAKLARYFKGIGINYHIEKLDTLKKTDRKKINCFWCSWNRRKALFETANRLKCTKVAFGHHKAEFIFSGRDFCDVSQAAVIQRENNYYPPLCLCREKAYRSFCGREENTL